MTSSMRRDPDSTDWRHRVMTVEEFRYANPLPDARTELVDGRLVVREPPFWAHGHAALRLAYALMRYVDDHRIDGKPMGHFSSNDPGMVLSREPGTVRGPDLAYFTAQRLPDDWNHWFEIPPDMVTEVRSSADRPGYLRRKLEDWQRWGCQNVWVLDPRDGTFTVMRPDGVTTVRDGDTFDGEPLFPAMNLPIASLFR